MEEKSLMIVAYVLVWFVAGVCTVAMWLIHDRLRLTLTWQGAILLVVGGLFSAVAYMIASTVSAYKDVFKR